MTLIKQSMYQKDLAKVINHIPRMKQLHGKSVLMIGASGTIGSLLVDTLIVANEQLDIKVKVYAMGRNRQEPEEKFVSYLALDTFEVVKGGVTEPLPEKIQADYLVHGTSNTHLKAYVTSPIGTIMTNLADTEQVLKYATATQPERVLFLSTIEIYGEDRGDTEKFTEDYYGHTDRNTLRVGYPEGEGISESLCQAYIAKYNLDIVIPRPCHTFGPTMLLSDTKVSLQSTLNAVEQKDIVLRSEGNQYFLYVYAGDAVSAILYLLLEGEKGEAYNVSSENFGLRLKESAQQPADTSGKQVIFELPGEIEQKGFSKASTAILDSRKIEKNGWYSMFELKEPLIHTVELAKGKKQNV